LPAAALPDDPNLEQLRKQAKDLRDLARAGIPGALELVGTHHPRRAHAVSLSGAQLVIARHYGFGSWADLARHLELIEHYRREPDEVEQTSDPADEFLALACLRYGGDDSPFRWQQAARLLREQPVLPASNIHVAAAAADVTALRALLAGDPSLARREGGPYGWEPILYLAYARHDAGLTREATLGAARLLLEHGADPNAGYLWHGLYPPFTALTGALGSGSDDKPEHPHGITLAAFLMEHGADANDGQALYDRQFGDDDSHLNLLLEHGLGQGDGGPWRARFWPHAESPADLVRGQLWWAIVHDLRDRARLLVEHGADFLTPYRTYLGRPSSLRTSDGRTPAEVAALSGNPELAAWLVTRGAAPPRTEGVDGLIAAALAGDLDTVTRLADHVEAARRERPGLIVWAASRHKVDGVRLLVELGWDINARARSDIPMEQAWETALHEAAGNGHLELARLLLDLGADPNLTDGRFQSKPVGWAERFGREEMISLLAPVTSG
jgi:Ankyrin repeats (3 copies)